MAVAPRALRSQPQVARQVGQVVQVARVAQAGQVARAGRAGRADPLAAVRPQGKLA